MLTPSNGPHGIEIGPTFVVNLHCGIQLVQNKSNTQLTLRKECLLYGRMVILFAHKIQLAAARIDHKFDRCGCWRPVAMLNFLPLFIIPPFPCGNQKNQRPILIVMNIVEILLLLCYTTIKHKKKSTK